MYTSTRNKVNISASKAILNGLALDGGLYVCENINSQFFSKKLLNYTYNELSEVIFEQFLDDYSKEVIKEIIKNCYDESFLPNQVNLKHFDDFSLLELFNGETFAFKDMALSILPKIFSEAKKINNINNKTIILTATSGDTGSAALSGFGEIENTFVIVLYPKNGVSEFQKLQMNSYAKDNCILIAVDGNFDECQRIVKEIFQKVKVKKSILSSANSINIGRIIPQIVYYFYTYFKLVRSNKIKFNDKINFTVPSGNFGNIYASYIAKQMGLPVNKLIIASNSNNVLTEIFNDYKYNINRELVKTISPSMDILVSSNFERYLYSIIKDEKKINNYMNDLKEKQIIYISELEQEVTFNAYFASEENTKDFIKIFYDTFGYVIDPHTAVGYYCNVQYKKENKDNSYNVILSTASPYKFSESVLNALGLYTTKGLQEQINLLKTISIENFDSRIEKVLNAKVKASDLSTSETFSYVKKVIGDIDDQD
jgi:threonine synthase